MNRLLASAGLMLATTLLASPPARAEPLPDVVVALRAAGGHYAWARATLAKADCSGLVSVAQSLATGQPVRRLGDTRSLLAGHWPHAIRGASESDAFVIGANSSHMVARVGGVNIEATTAGEPFRFGPDAASPFEPRFVTFHLDEAVLDLA